MQYRTLGRTGLRVSEMGVGGAQVGIRNYTETWEPTGEAEQQSILDALNRALDLGLNYIDTAPAHGDGVSEEVLGRVVGKRREECIVASKTSARDPEGITASVENSLRRLRTDSPAASCTRRSFKEWGSPSCGRSPAVSSNG